VLKFVQQVVAASTCGAKLVYCMGGDDPELIETLECVHEIMAAFDVATVWAAMVGAGRDCAQGDAGFAEAFLLRLEEVELAQVAAGKDIAVRGAGEGGDEVEESGGEQEDLEVVEDDEEYEGEEDEYAGESVDYREDVIGSDDESGDSEEYDSEEGGDGDNYYLSDADDNEHDCENDENEPDGIAMIGSPNVYRLGAEDVPPLEEDDDESHH